VCTVSGIGSRRVFKICAVIAKFKSAATSEAIMKLVLRVAILWGFVVLGSMLILTGYMTSKEKDPALWFLFALLAISVALLTALFIVVWKEGKG
jgi:Na+/melibiose symporter-like transporter